MASRPESCGYEGPMSKVASSAKWLMTSSTSLRAHAAISARTISSAVIVVLFIRGGEQLLLVSQVSGGCSGRERPPGGERKVLARCRQHLKAHVIGTGSAVRVEPSGNRRLVPAGDQGI